MPDHIPIVTKSEMAELDRRMIEEYSIPLEIMMENAGKSLAVLTERLFSVANRVVVLIGPGNNGGGGIVAARHLLNWGKDVVVLLSQWKKDTAGMLKEQLTVLENTSVDIVEAPSLDEKQLTEICTHSGIILDALLGYSVDGNPRGEIERLIQMTNSSEKPVISLDLPSGLSPDDGAVYEPIVRAVATLTIATPKRGLQTAGAESYVGDIYLADISVPFSWYQERGMTHSPFGKDFIVRL